MEKRNRAYRRYVRNREIQRKKRINNAVYGYEKKRCPNMKKRCPNNATILIL